MKPVVLFILADLGAGGAQRVILRLLHRLRGDNVEYHLGIVRSQGPLRKEIPKHLPVHDLNARRVRYAPLKILSLCWSLKPSVVVSTLGHLNVSLLMLKPFLPRKTGVIVREANTPSVRLQHTSVRERRPKGGVPVLPGMSSTRLTRRTLYFESVLLS